MGTQILQDSEASDGDVQATIFLLAGSKRRVSFVVHPVIHGALEIKARVDCDNNVSDAIEKTLNVKVIISIIDVRINIVNNEELI